jgi:hypothetical protein
MNQICYAMRAFHKIVSPCHNFQTEYGTYTSSYDMVKGALHLEGEERSETEADHSLLSRAEVTSVPHMSLWHGAQSSTGTNFYVDTHEQH